MKSITSIIFFLALCVAPGLTQTLDFGHASQFAILCANSIKNTGKTTVTGNVGVKGLIVDGFPPGKVTGKLSFAGRGNISTGILDASAARSAAMALQGTPLTTLGSGQILTPGVYSLAKIVVLTGDLTFVGAGEYIIQIQSGLSVVTGTKVALTGGASADNITWVIGGTVTFQPKTEFKGSILTGGQVQIGSGTAINGNIYTSSTLVLNDNKIGLVN